MQNACLEQNSEPYNPLSAAQRIRPDLLGFVFHLSWIYLLLYSDVIVRSRTNNLVAVNDAAYLTSAVTLMVVLALGIISTRRFMKICESRFAVIFAPFAMALGTIFYCVIQIEATDALMIAGGLLTGIGSAMMAARWASVFGGASSRAVIENLPTLIATIVVICVSTRFVPQEICFAFVILMPIFSACALKFARNYQHGIHHSSKKNRAENNAS